MIEIKSSGSFQKTERFLASMKKQEQLAFLDSFGRQGVALLAAATPVDTGLTASSWTYEVVRKRSWTSIIWSNTNVEDGLPVAILLQYGHATGTGGYVQGYDYINPAIQPLFDRIADAVWEKVKS